MLTPKNEFIEGIWPDSKRTGLLKWVEIKVNKTNSQKSRALGKISYRIYIINSETYGSHLEYSEGGRTAVDSAATMLYKDESMKLILGHFALAP